MKITLISPSPSHLDAMSQQLGLGPHQIRCVLGGKSHMRELAEQDPPDLMLVDGMCCDPGELTQVEHITLAYPEMAVVLLCASQTPEFLLQSMRVGVREVLPSPASPEALDQAVARVAAKLKSGHKREPGKLLAFMGCKGGSGATFLATNLGFQLAESRSVLLLDLNLQFGDALSFVHEGQPHATLADVSQDISRLDASFLAACAVKINPRYHVLAAPEDMAQATSVKPEHVDALLTLALAHYDFVLVDMSRTLDTLALHVLDRAHRIFPVLQADLPGVRNAARLLAAFRSLAYAPSKIEPIVNRFEKSGEISLDAMERSLGVSLRTVPNSYKEVSQAINHGAALAQEARANPVTRQLTELALSLSPRPDETRSLLGRLFRRA